MKHRLDSPFDYEVFFDLASKITDKIIFFGRGDSFYEWNLIAAKKGFKFKEEIIWNKGHLSNPCGNLARLHETISVRMKKGNSINKVFIDYIKNNLRLGNYQTLISMLDKMEYLAKRGDKYFLNVRRLIRLGKVYFSKKKGGGYKITTSIKKDSDRCIKQLQTLLRGNKMQSIVKVNRDHYQNKTGHPTCKPVELARLLVKLGSNEGDLILDPFMGSGNLLCGALIENRRVIGCEIDEEYFINAKNRIETNYNLFNTVS